MSSTDTYRAVYAQSDPGNGIGGYDLMSAAGKDCAGDIAMPFDYDGTLKRDHIVLYRPGSGTICVLKNTSGIFSPVYAQSYPGLGIGGYDLKSSCDLICDFDYDHTAKLDHLVIYRPGTGIVWILKNSGGNFLPVYASMSGGIGGYDLSSPDDRIFAYDYDSSGRRDYLVLYRPGTGKLWILKNVGGSFTAVYAKNTGIGGFDLSSSLDHAFAFDYEGNGLLDEIVLYRPGSGIIQIVQKQSGEFKTIYGGDAGQGIGGYTLSSTADRAFAFAWDGGNKMDEIVLYRPGAGMVWIVQRKGTTYEAVFASNSEGCGGYDFKSPADRCFAFDYQGIGNGQDHLVPYRPGTGTIWILERTH